MGLALSGAMSTCSVIGWQQAGQSSTHSWCVPAEITAGRPAPLTVATFRERISGAANQGRAREPRVKKFTAEQITGKFREAEVGLAQGKTVPGVVRELGVAEQTYYRWKRKYVALRTDQAMRLTDLKKESARLKRLLADADHAHHPERFVQGVPRPLTPAAEVWINPPENRPTVRTLELPRDTNSVPKLC